jgi:hypothetical protein
MEGSLIMLVAAGFGKWNGALFMTHKDIKNTVVFMGDCDFDFL